jgi:hypothetical protein
MGKGGIVNNPAHQRIGETDSFPRKTFYRAECDCGWFGPWGHDRERAAGEAVIHNRMAHVARTVSDRMLWVKAQRS